MGLLSVGRNLIFPFGKTRASTVPKRFVAASFSAIASSTQKSPPGREGRAGSLREETPSRFGEAKCGLTGTHPRTVPRSPEHRVASPAG